MNSWPTNYDTQSTYRVHRASFSSTCSQEADSGGGPEHQKMATPSSPVFDLDEFIYDPVTTTSTTAALTSGSAATGGMSGLTDVAQLGSAARHANGHSWTTSGGDGAGWESASNVFQETASNAFYGVSFPSSAGTHSKPSLKTTTTPQAILNNYYGGGLASFHQPASSGFSDFELGLDSSNSAELFAFPTKTGALADQQHHHSMFDQGLYPDMNKMMLLSQSEPGYAYPTQAQAQQHLQRRGSVRRESTSSLPFSTATSIPLNIQAPSFSYAQPSTVFPTSVSGHTPSSSLSSSSFLSNLSPGSPLGSPHFSERGLSISPSIPPASPLSASAVGAIYFHQGPGTSPTPSFGGVPPAQLSASPHQFSSAPITFVNQTTQFTKPTKTSTNATRDSSPKDADADEYSPLMDERSHDDGMRQRKRRRTLSNSVMGDESDDKRDEDIPIKSELRPPKQAPSMWQVYFADWLQDHKTRHPHDKLNVAQAAKEAGQLYKTLTAAEKEDLKRRVQIEKQLREQRLVAWQRTLTPNDIKRENKFRAAQRKAGLSRRANIKDPNAPKKPLSAYFMFLAKIRSDPRLVEEVFGGETETTRQSVLAAQTWREMSDEEKKPFLTQAEHDKIQYEALRKIYEEQAGSSSANARKQMAAGTGYIVPQQMNTTLSDDVTASILSANPNTGNRYSSHGGSDSDDLHMVSYDPQATITARKSSTTASSKAIATAAAAASFASNGKAMSSSIPVSFSATGTIRRRTAAARKSARQIMMDDGAQSPPDSSEDDDEWVPGKSV
ncbi:SubName: Full=Uncharacterized protein {ECO:0000313/EMBL:CCA71712.1} [Serendipita indica DSM 11827]|uniref:HMG box domain-containing protein n=1 Tax=Serendipita indica (strain DSM 11827) TaxID=1109443 RepID=G4TK61_SERID|nr:SubName: Full=Uncharacterized protein {ECO:0000313/EMBL:CCA71712.1} [Serendipita indica DSM 11827]CCA71712.1 hypothetical protein PIIN_05647 [Serendipita indica DSM 11827]